MSTPPVTLRLPVATKRRLAAAARQRGLTLSRYLIETAERDVQAIPASLPVSPTAYAMQKFLRPESVRPVRHRLT